MKEHKCIQLELFKSLHAVLQIRLSLTFNDTTRVTAKEEKGIKNKTINQLKRNNLSFGKNFTNPLYEGINKQMFTLNLSFV